MDTDLLIIGAGLTGLSLAYHLDRDYIILERDSRPGGLAKTEKEKGFLFDYTGHLLHLKNDYTRGLIKEFLKDNLNEKERRSWIFSKDVFTRYPFQKNTYGLPPEIIKEIIIGFVNRKERKIVSFEDWIFSNFGSGIAKHFMLPYNEKLWTVSAADLTTDWLGGYIPNVTLDEIIDGALSDLDEAVGYNATFFYPKRGGIESLVEAFHQRIERERLLLNEEAVKINHLKKIVTTKSGTVIKYNSLVNTSPLKFFIDSIDTLNSELESAKNDLKYTSVYNHNFAIKGEKFRDRDWIYLPETEFICYRMGTPTNFSEHIAPKGFTTVYTEVSYSDFRPLERTNIREKIIKVMKRAGLIESEKEIEAEKILDIKTAYVIYNHKRKSALRTIGEFLKNNDILSIGRYGKWEYSAMEDAIIQGKKSAERLNERR